jgi:glucose/mannose transport system permease protein
MTYSDIPRARRLGTSIPSERLASHAMPPPARPPAPPSETVRTGRFDRSTILRHLVLWALMALFLLPVYLLVVTAFKDPSTVSTTRMWQLPTSLSLDSFRTVFPALSGGFRNSMVIAIPASIIAAMLGCANGFVLAKWRFPGANLVFPLILFGIFVPYQAVLIPLVRTTTAAGLRGGDDPSGGLRGLILIHIIYGLPITTLIFRNFFAAMPMSFIESSQVDGAGLLRTFFDVGVPLARPAFAVAIIWQFTAVWNDFLFGAVMTGRNAWPITIALNNIAGGQSAPLNEAMASALLACVPTVAVYVLLGRYFMRGMMAGTLQG